MRKRLAALLTAFGLLQAVSADAVAICSSEDLDVIVDGSLTSSLWAANREHVVALPSEGNTVKLKLLDGNQNDLRPVLRCSIRIETCSSCLLNIEYRKPLDFFSAPDAQMMSYCMDAPSEPCFDFRFIEEKADSVMDLEYRKVSIWEDPSRSSFISTGGSLMVTVTLRNIDSNSSMNAFVQNFFPIDVKSISNTEVITGSPAEFVQSMNDLSIGFVESPRYPAAYPRLLTKRYVLRNSNPSGFVRLVFDDFHIHYQSEIQILDSDGSMLSHVMHENIRPPALLSHGPNMTIIFDAHDFTNVIGFRARYEFVDNYTWPERPNGRNCDEQLEGYGGTISLDGNSHLMHTYVDCIWLIGRLQHQSRIFDKLYLMVEDFHLKGVGLKLEVRQGPSSTSDRVLLLIDTQSRDQLEHKQPHFGFSAGLPNSAFYVRLQGFLLSTNGLEIVYSQYYRWATPQCLGVGEFHCDNSRCIKSSLRCDNVDHCGDGSDEICNSPSSDFRSPEPDISGLLALVVGVCALIILIVSTAAVMTKCYRRRSAGGHQNRQLTAAALGNQLGPSIQTVGERRFYVVPENQISVIEAPPSYDDALKHPAVRTSRSNSYANQGYATSVSDLQDLRRSLSPDGPLPSLEDEPVPSTSTAARTSTPRPQSRAQSSRDASTAASQNDSEEEQETTNTQPENEESWV